jgi:nucleoside-diphosphate-sugar epimerase
MTILVTGASGFVGLNVLEHLLAAGRTVIGLDRNPLPQAARKAFAALPGTLTFFTGSIESAEDLKAAFISTQVGCVIHCAVITAGAKREATDPESIIAINVQGAIKALTAATRFGAKRFVYPSSGAVYGLAARDATLLDEDTLVPQPANLYGASKLAAEIVLACTARSQRIEFVAARLGTVFGPWEYATGVRDTLSPMLQTLEHLRRGETVVLSPAHRVDYIYSRDVAAGLVCLAEASSIPRGLYNLGTGRTATAAEWCRLLTKLRPDFRWWPAAEGETPNVVTHTSFDRPAMNVEHLLRDLNFRANSSLADAAEDYLRFR